MARIPSAARNPIALRLTPLGIVALLVILALIAAGVLALDGWISVPQGNFVILLHKTGSDLPNEEILATADQKGVQLEVVKEGYHWYNPYTYYCSPPQPATIVPEMQVGIVTRKYGKPLPEGGVLATGPDEKGVLAEPLSPGRHYLNTYAYSVNVVPMVKIDPGYVGVVTLLVGNDPTDANTFVVKEGERGTQPYLLKPGVHPKYSNPWMYKVVPIDVRSQKLDMSGENGVDFLSEDGFPIHTEGTIEYALDLNRLPEMFVMYVDEADLEQSGGLKNIEEKLILPYGRSLYRIYGAQHKAVDYLLGVTRVKVQTQVEAELREVCAKDGINIRSFVINSTEPPQQIRQQYERRELANRQTDQFQAELIKEIGAPVIDGGKPRVDADGQPVFDKNGRPVVDGGTPRLDAKGEPVYAGGRLSQELQARMKDRAEKIGAVRLEIAGVTREAEQYGKVELTKANQRLAVAKLQLEAANDIAGQTIAAGEAKAAVIKMKNAAEAAGAQATVDAFGGGDKYAQYLLTTRFAPAIQGIWSNTDGFFADIFRNLAEPPKPAAGAAPATSDMRSP